MASSHVSISLIVFLSLSLSLLDVSLARRNLLQLSPNLINPAKPTDLPEPTSASGSTGVSSSTGLMGPTGLPKPTTNATPNPQFNLAELRKLVPHLAKLRKDLTTLFTALINGNKEEIPQDIKALVPDFIKLVRTMPRPKLPNLGQPAVPALAP